MIRWLLAIAGGLALVVAGLAFWLLLADSDAATADPFAMDIAGWRELAASQEGELPLSVVIIEVGKDTAPAFAAVAGRFDGPVEMSYNYAFINFMEGDIVVGGAVDRETATGMRVSDADWAFDDDRYELLLDRIRGARATLLTHAHLDHVMAIARHPDLAAVADRYLLNEGQLALLPRFVPEGDENRFAGMTPSLALTAPTAIAPGVVVIPSPGHTPGSQMVFITDRYGSEVLLIGDIVWNMAAIETLRTRPVLTQYAVFRPDYEDRAAVKSQVRALHDLMAAEPDLVVVPAHDRGWLRALNAAGTLSFLALRDEE